MVFAGSVVGRGGELRNPGIRSFLLFSTLFFWFGRGSFVFCRTPETCSHVASMLAQAKDEFVRQTITAPETVAELLDVLYLGGGGCSSGDRSGVSDRESGEERGTAGVQAACRLSSARVLIAIFSAVDESDVVR